MTTHEIHFPVDMTSEEHAFLQLVKENMLKKLSDRNKFIFIYCFELGHDQKEAAKVLELHETNISRHIKQIRSILAPFNYKM